MKFTANAAALAPVLTRLAKVPEARTTIPVLNTVLLNAGPDGLIMTATDMDRWMAETLDIPATEPGRACVPARELARTVSALPEGADVELEQDGNTVVVRSGRGRWTLPALSPDDFPPTPAMDGDTWTIPATTLVDALKLTVPFVNQDESKYYLKGVNLMRTENGDLKLRATNSHILSHVTLDGLTDVSIAKYGGVIIPTASVNLLTTALAKAEGMVDVAINEHRAHFAHGGQSITTRLLDAEFPDTDRVVPSYTNTVTTTAAQLDTLAKRARDMLDQKISKDATFAFRADEIHVTATNRNDGRTYADACEAETAAELDAIGFNAWYLVQVLDGLGEGSEPITLHFGTSMDPMLVTCESWPQMQRVIMPTRIN